MSDTRPPDNQNAGGFDIGKFQEEQIEKRRVDTLQTIERLRAIVQDADKQTLESIRDALGKIDINTLEGRVESQQIDATDTLTGEQSEGGDESEQLVERLRAKVAPFFEQYKGSSFNDEGHLTGWFAQQMKEAGIDLVPYDHAQRAGVKTLKQSGIIPLGSSEVYIQNQKQDVALYVSWGMTPEQEKVMIVQIV